ncbi:MAG: hypothetical protein D6744_10250 [Planctomycetota bacterium]|nr:MAG: hypothetical protein D6744_10250 [Planctomycetota bacterium]
MAGMIAWTRHRLASARKLAYDRTARLFARERKMDHSSPAALPTLISLLLCDQVIDDRMTNKKSAIGLFNTIVVNSTPARLPHLAVMATLTEIGSRTPLELRLVSDADNDTLISTHGAVEAPNPLAMVDLVFAMQGVQIPRPGQYAFELHAGDHILGRRRFHVLRAQRKEQ